MTRFLKTGLRLGGLALLAALLAGQPACGGSSFDVQATLVQGSGEPCLGARRIQVVLLDAQGNELATENQFGTFFDASTGECLLPLSLPLVTQGLPVKDNLRIRVDVHDSSRDHILAQGLSDPFGSKEIGAGDLGQIVVDRLSVETGTGPVLALGTIILPALEGLELIPSDASLIFILNPVLEMPYLINGEFQRNPTLPWTENSIVLSNVLPNLSNELWVVAYNRDSVENLAAWKSDPFEVQTTDRLITPAMNVMP